MTVYAFEHDTDNLPTTVATALSPVVFSHIYKPEHNIAIWQRSLAEQLQKEVAESIAANPDLSINAVINEDSIRTDIDKALEKLPSAQELKADLAKLVDMFCYLFELKRTGLRLRVLERAMCPRFHVDRVPCRLVSTYCGSGSQWLQNAGLDRTKLGAGHQGLSDEESGLMTANTKIHSLNEGDVALLKGETWQNNEGKGLVHRSPVLAAGEKRLLVTLDFIA
ncbi:DUF1826 domain-containing protein [Pseudoalteromonas sp.]|uniref:DUF1826 domain-containing protein n=1 Tax=Pseudoalteromonas sp. TaxID=53249 RepID=UPI002619174C|nr:DUF1826 domain-containing protein [Pseudoalteromonas sp.]MCP4588885.1 DUF1826 domain-containing protein [Pseudoalteromonas sp.]